MQGKQDYSESSHFGFLWSFMIQVLSSNTIFESSILRETARPKGAAEQVYLKHLVMSERKEVLRKDDGIMFRCHMSQIEGTH